MRSPFDQCIEPEGARLMTYDEFAKKLVVPVESAIAVWTGSGPCVQALERADVYVVHPLSLLLLPP